MSKKSTLRCLKTISYVTAGALILASQQVSAAAFALKEQSASYLGTAFSGTAANAEKDASTGWYNPAGLVELPNSQLGLSGIYIKSHVKLYDATATSDLGAPATGNNPTKPKGAAFIPALHAAWKIDKCWAVGFNIIAPFGLNLKYSGTDIARYMSTESKIVTVDYSPSVAYRINDQFDVGLGLDFMHVNARLYANTNYTPLLPVEGYVQNKLHGWGYGFHIGAMYKPSSRTQMGLAYFSRMKPKVKGDTAAANLPVTLPTSVSGHVNLPDRIVYSVTHQYDDNWTAMGDLEWTHWSTLQTLRLNYNTGLTTYEYFFNKNSWRISLGTEYKFKPCLIFKGGLSWEQSPVNNIYRDSRLPDSNRYWIALGVKYMFNKNMTVDAGYAHVFFKNSSIQQRGVGVATSLYGNYKSSADLVGVQLMWNFV